MSPLALRAGYRIITFKVASFRTTVVANMPRVTKAPEQATLGAKMEIEEQKHGHLSIVRVAALAVKRHDQLPNSAQSITP